MRLTQLAAEEAAAPKRTYKRKERTPVLAMLPACNDALTAWVTAVCAKLGAAQLAIVGVNAEGQPVFAPIYTIDKTVVSESGKEKVTTIFATRKVLPNDPSTVEGAKTYFTFADGDDEVFVTPASVSAVSGIPMNGEDVANTFDSILFAGDDGTYEIIGLKKENATFHPADPTITADDGSIWKLDASVFPYQTGEVRIGITIEKPARALVAIEDLVEIEDLPEL